MFAVIIVVSGALIIGALWGLYGRLPSWLEGNLLALAGGALMISVVIELIQPAVTESGVWVTAAFAMLGAVVFASVDYLLDEKLNADGGSGLLAVALISGNVMQVAALAGSILLSNLPEAAGGAKEMRRNGASNKKVLMLWIGAAILLSLAAILGKVLLKNVDDAIISAINCFAAGAVIASLATEVFPTAFKRSNHWAGISTTVGLILALALNQLGG